jgi:hypothetical protein
MDIRLYLLAQKCRADPLLRMFIGTPLPCSASRDHAPVSLAVAVLKGGQTSLITSLEFSTVITNYARGSIWFLACNH